MIVLSLYFKTLSKVNKLKTSQTSKSAIDLKSINHLEDASIAACMHSGIHVE